jgi:hypothetical protein
LILLLNRGWPAARSSMMTSIKFAGISGVAAKLEAHQGASRLRA